jgi:hypothetical protein
MPFKSKAQAGLFFAKEARGELPKGTAERWAKETPGGIKSLPKHAPAKPGTAKGELLRRAHARVSRKAVKPL